MSVCTTTRRAPECTVYTGPMGSGKSIEAMRWVRRRGNPEQVVFISPTTDTRSRTWKVESRNGCTAPAIKVKVLMSLFLNLEDSQEEKEMKDKVISATAIVLDEAQFFGWADLIAFTTKCLDDWKDVCIAGLDTDKDQKPFMPLAELHELATRWEKLTACCKLCNDGTEAGHTIYLGDEKPIINEGGNSVLPGNKGYVAVCRKHILMHRRGELSS